ncbi:LysR family transcriptional regulator [Pseudomonas sp. JZ134]|uniref:LysR family transcriptional regulator n=1 Tax=Pseudomonas sp. JZ134 TaxID=2806615 RepID=UPI003DA08A9B
MDINFRQLRAFVLIAETSSFTRTSEQLHLSQPALSYSIRKLEEAVGLQLLARNTRSVELTPGGEHFLSQARRMLSDMDNAVRDARETLSLSRGTIRLAALPTAAASFLPEAIAAFMGDHPGVQVSLRDGRAGEVRAWVQSGEVDAGITSRPEDLSGLSFEALVNDNLVLLAPRGRISDGKKKAQVWQALPYIALTPDTSIRPLADAALHLLKVPAEPAWEVAHMSTAAALVRAGLGFSLLPASCTAFLRIDNELLVVPLKQTGQRSLGFLQKKPIRHTPSMRAFMVYLTRQLAANAT